MSGKAELLATLAAIAAEADRLRSQASESLRQAVGQATERGLTQSEIAQAIGRSQPEVSRLIRSYRNRRFVPRSRLGRLLTRNRDQVLALARSHRVSNVRVFGSVARGDDDAASDIDLLVDLEPGADLLDLAGLEVELQDLLGRRIDLVPARMLRPHVAPKALEEAVAL